MKRKTVYVIGAGSTAKLGIPTSDKQKKIFEGLAGSDSKMLRRLCHIVAERFANNEYGINDVFNLIDTALYLKTGLYYNEEKIEYLELLQSKRELISLIFEAFKKNIEAMDDCFYKRYVDFYYQLAKRELNKKIECNIDMQEREFFIADYSIINFNWDLCSLFPIIESNRILNHENDRYINKEGLPQLRMYTDFNYECASTLNDLPWYPFTEPAAAIANSDKHMGKRRVVLLKAFYPHGLMNSFKCPKCARHSLYLGSQLEIKEVSKSIDYSKDKLLYKCPNCGAEISAKDFNVLVQSNFKERNSFLEETRIKMFCELESAEKLVFIGYSMPQDDVDYRTFFKSLNNVKEVHVVLKDKNSHNFKRISNGDDVSNYSDETRTAIENYISVFKNICLNTKGFPDAANDILEIK